MKCKKGYDTNIETQTIYMLKLKKYYSTHSIKKNERINKSINNYIRIRFRLSSYMLQKMHPCYALFKPAKHLILKFNIFLCYHV